MLSADRVRKPLQIIDPGTNQAVQPPAEAQPAALQASPSSMLHPPSGLAENLCGKAGRPLLTPASPFESQQTFVPAPSQQQVQFAMQSPPNPPPPMQPSGGLGSLGCLPLMQGSSSPWPLGSRGGASFLSSGLMSLRTQLESHGSYPGTPTPMHSSLGGWIGPPAPPPRNLQPGPKNLQVCCSC